eukprot:gene15013-17755_t
MTDIFTEVFHIISLSSHHIIGVKEAARICHQYGEEANLASADEYLLQIVPLATDTTGSTVNQEELVNELYQRGQKRKLDLETQATSSSINQAEDTQCNQNQYESRRLTILPQPIRYAYGLPPQEKEATPRLLSECGSPLSEAQSTTNPLTPTYKTRSKPKPTTATPTPTADVYSSKDVENAASEATGLNKIQVSETMKLLIEDGVVQTDKIGAGNFYWAFSSYEFDSKSHQKATLASDIEDIKERIAQEKEKIQKLQSGRVETDERKSQLEKLADLQEQTKQLKEELGNYGDVETIELMKKELKIAVLGANRNTDNIDCLRAFCDKKYNIQREDFNKNFQIDPNMDYLEE